MSRLLSLACACGIFLFLITRSGAEGVPSALADAAEKKEWPAVARLLAEKADPNAAQIDGATALHWAAHYDQSDVVRQLIAAGANAATSNRYGVTPLALACTNGSDTIVTALLGAGAIGLLSRRRRRG